MVNNKGNNLNISGGYYMDYCKTCGGRIKEGVKFCPSCGSKIEENFQQQEDAIAVSNMDTGNIMSDKSDIEQNKVMGFVCYLSWLVLIPIFTTQNSKFVRFHANQGLILAIAETGYWIINKIIVSILTAIFINNFYMWGVYTAIVTLLNMVNIIFLVLFILGMINVSNGRFKELPIIGKFKILK